MSYAVIGAGAVGTLLAVSLARTGNQVVLIGHANGSERILRRRVEIEPATRSRPESVRYSIVRESKPAAGETTVLCVKAHQIAAAVTEHAPSFAGAETVVVVQGGIPWWYFFAAPGAHVDRQIAAVDPDGRIARAIAPRSIVGGVIETSVVHTPGSLHTGSIVRLELGEIDNVVRPRTEKLARGLQRRPRARRGDAAHPDRHLAEVRERRGAPAAERLDARHAGRAMRRSHRPRKTRRRHARSAHAGRVV